VSESDSHQQPGEGAEHSKDWPQELQVLCFRGALRRVADQNHNKGCPASRHVAKTGEAIGAAGREAPPKGGG
jgi:hypothetical protein